MSYDIYFLIKAWRLISRERSCISFSSTLRNYLSTNAVRVFSTRENVKSVPAVIFNQTPSTR